MVSNKIVIAENIGQIQQRIAKAAQKAGRLPSDIQLLAVSKTKPVSDIEAAYHAGQRQFGENYLQEAVAKIEQLKHLGIEWHFIGPLQSNKTRLAAEMFDWVHTVDRIKIARRLSEQRPDNKPPLNICLQVNIDHEASKSGVAPNELPELAKAVLQLPGIKLRGLMAIPAASNDSASQHKAFSRLSDLLKQLQRHFPDHNGFDTLSMGMSGDMEAAISEGATMVRIGTDVFGARNTQQDKEQL